MKTVVRRDGTGIEPLITNLILTSKKDIRQGRTFYTTYSNWDYPQNP